MIICMFKNVKKDKYISVNVSKRIDKNAYVKKWKKREIPLGKCE